MPLGPAIVRPFNSATVRGPSARVRIEKASALRQAVPTAVQQKAASARDTAQKLPGLLAAVAAALVLVLLVRRLLKGR